MKNACFLAPIHPPKFNFGLDLIKTYNQYYNDDHFFLIFSSQSDLEQFAELAVGLRYQSIISPPLVGQSPTTEKKFNGIKWIYENTNFEYVAAVDVDTLFIKNVDYSQLFENYYKKATIWGNLYEFAPWPIITNPLKFFHEFWHERLYNATHGYRVYFWFNDIPVYKKLPFLAFLDFIKYNTRANELVWFDFDYILYGYFLIASGQFKLEVMTLDNQPVPNIFIEGQRGLPPDIFNRMFSICKPMWILDPIDERLMDQTFMLVHVDLRKH
jgi:hypothetical protein